MSGESSLLATASPEELEEFKRRRESGDYGWLIFTDNELILRIRKDFTEQAGVIPAKSPLTPLELGTMIIQEIVAAGGTEQDTLRIKDDVAFRRALAQFVLKNNLSPKTSAFPVWRTLEAKAHKSVVEIKAALAGIGCKISNRATDILSCVLLPKEPEMIDFVRVAVSDLGFTEPATPQAILEAGQKLGLKPCFPIDGVTLRIGYPDQPLSKEVCLAMEPVNDYNGCLRIFRVFWYDNNLYLGTDLIDFNNLWNPKDEFFFRK